MILLALSLLAFAMGIPPSSSEVAPHPQNEIPTPHNQTPALITFNSDTDARDPMVHDMSSPFPTFKCFKESKLSPAQLLGIAMASGNSLNDLGNFDACMALDYAQYCLFTKVIKPYYLPVNVGLCTPKTCTSEDLVDVIKSAVKFAFKVESDINASDVHCHQTPKVASIVHDRWGMIGLCILLTLVAIVSIATIMDLIQKQCSKGYSYTTIVSESEYLTVGQGRLEIYAFNHPSIPIRILGSFSLLYNFSRLFQPYTPTRTGCLHGIRVLSMVAVLYGHTMVMLLPGISNVVELVTKYMPKYMFATFFGSFYAVDTFFYMSGFLLAYVVIREMKNNQIKGWSWMVKACILRYWRLMPLVVVTIFVSFVVPYAGDGPAWFEVQGYPLITDCKKNWWKILLFVQDIGFGDTLYCQGHLWYLANDYKFFVIGLILLSVYWHVSAAYMFVLTSLMGIVSAVFNWIDNPSALEIQYYSKPYVRITPYLYGLLTGVLLHNLIDSAGSNGRGGRNTLTRASETELGRIRSIGRSMLDGSGAAGIGAKFIEATENATHSPIARRVAYILSVAIMIGNVTFIWYKLQRGFNQKPLPLSIQKICSVTGALGWGLSLTLFLIPFFHGYGGAVQGFLSHSFWVPLSRVTYAMYVVHPLVYVYVTGHSNALFEFNFINVFYLFWGNTFCALIGGTVAWLFVEKPFSNLGFLMFGNRE